MRELVRKLFTLDLRSLGALRIALGLVALLDIFYYRWPHAEMLLSDRGVLPLELFGKLYDSSYWSLYRLSGEPTFVSALLLLQAVAAIAFLIGYRVRVASVLLLVLFWSVQARNPL
ncbi:MAG: HTTM domain-containing protein, partial [Planctomycetota bacterium]